jgi:anthranilate phosphoribosyltransferase
MPVRRELGIRTAFNLLGPLTNPAHPSFQLVGVGSPDWAELVARALAALGVERALVVHGAGTDELTCASENVVITVEGGAISRSVISAHEVGLDSEANPVRSPTACSSTPEARSWRRAGRGRSPRVSSRLGRSSTPATR